MKSFEDLDIASAMAYLKKKEIKSLELTEFFIDKIQNKINRSDYS